MPLGLIHKARVAIYIVDSECAKHGCQLVQAISEVRDMYTWLHDGAVIGWYVYIMRRPCMAATKATATGGDQYGLM